jgi:thiol-disulfide isomerase/thioredoxin
MSVALQSYEEFARNTNHEQDAMRLLAKDYGTVYVYALTRDRCSGCEIQKPLYEALARKTQAKYNDRVKFGIIHVSEQDSFRKKLQDFRELLKFAAYPTYLVLANTETGVAEVYRGIEPPMEEIARSIDIAIELLDR